MSKVDTRIRHVTKPGENLFAELGFAPDEARPYQEQSRALIMLARVGKPVKVVVG